ncbi:D-alanine--D-alanine ligase [Puniceicoccaceae bacterium K14]|nr:D-alanine--D-alanine ligase [Puniceicoccaceae bacterium K14]
MKSEPRLAILYGGVSAEREVSLGSGKAAAESFSKFCEVDLIDVTDAALPAALDPAKHIVFSTLHGTFGEDGQIQKLMEEAGIVYAGCDSKSSALTFDKVDTKEALRERGISVCPEFAFEAEDSVDLDTLISVVGEDVVIKPRRQGSSIGLAFAKTREEIESAFSGIKEGPWVVEPRINGRECTIGVVNGEVYEIVEIKPHSGTFDYQSKYTKGGTEYIAPAVMEIVLVNEVKKLALDTYRACGCRDFARVDFMINEQGQPFVLEVNSLPGLKETSLLPMSAGAAGHNFDNLLRLLIEPAKQRFASKYSFC